MIRLLKNLVGADARIGNSFKSIDIKRRSIDINPSDFTIAFFYRIYGASRFRNVFSIVFWVFSEYQYQAFLAIVLQGFYFLY